jgi:hypothetical protein
MCSVGVHWDGSTGLSIRMRARPEALRWVVIGMAQRQIDTEDRSKA